MRVWWITLASLLIVSASGCLGGQDDGKASSSTTSSAAVPEVPVLILKIKAGNDTFAFTTAKSANAANTTSSSGTTTATSNATNSTGNATGNATAKPTVPTGIAPVEVTFTIGALNVTGPFNWTLKTGDDSVNAPTASNLTGNSTNATAPPPGPTIGNTTSATVTHVYNLTGNWTPSLLLRYGNNSRLELKATVVVAAGAAANATNGTDAAAGGIAPGTPLGSLPFAAEGTFTLGVQAPACGGGIDGERFFDWIFPATDANGVPAAVNKVVLTITPGTGSVDLGVSLLGPDGAVVGNADGGFQGAETLTIEKDLAPGTYRVRAYACASVGSFTVDGEAALVAA